MLPTPITATRFLTVKSSIAFYIGDPAHLRGRVRAVRVTPSIRGTRREAGAVIGAGFLGGMAHG
jgi:hypothetical protein